MSMTRTTYSPKLKDALDDLRPAFRDLGQGLDQLTRKRAEIAPTFAKAWTLWQRETHRPFIAFVQALDPHMPVSDRAAYRKHASYRAAQYLQQLAAEPGETTRRGLTPLGMLAVTIKSVMPLFKSERERQDAVRILLGATKWREQDRVRLIAAIDRAKAVGLPNAPRLVEVNKMTKAVVVAFERERLSA